VSVDSSTVLIEGPWRHQFVPANGARFHVAVSGPDNRDAPLVVLLHGFPEFWWAWRHQLRALAEAGYRVAAMDLRGTGASDKPPIGYDVPTLTRDVAGLVRSLGVDRAVIVGHGIGATVAWAMGSREPAVTAAVGALSFPHPVHSASLGRGAVTPGALRHLLYFQLPTLPERSMARTDLIPRLLSEWGAPGWLAPEVAEIHRSAAQVPFAAHSAMERLRWMVRSTPRADGRRYLTSLKAPLTVPVLQLHGALDRCRPARTAMTPAALAGPAFRYELVADAGHFLPEEQPDVVSDLLLDWLGEVAPIVG
jgi:pimeloyl-ACP methyl ester carboxylesterase